MQLIRTGLTGYVLRDLHRPDDAFHQTITSSAEAGSEAVEFAGVVVAEQPAPANSPDPAEAMLLLNVWEGCADRALYCDHVFPRQTVHPHEEATGCTASARWEASVQRSDGMPSEKATQRESEMAAYILRDW